MQDIAKVVRFRKLDLNKTNHNIIIISTNKIWLKSGYSTQISDLGETTPVTTHLSHLGSPSSHRDMKYHLSNFLLKSKSQKSIWSFLDHREKQEKLQPFTMHFIYFVIEKSSLTFTHNIFSWAWNFVASMSSLSFRKCVRYLSYRFS